MSLVNGSKVVRRCFRMKCVCWEYFKTYNTLPTPQREYEICYDKNYKEYARTLEAPQTPVYSQESEKVRYVSTPLL